MISFCKNKRVSKLKSNWAIAIFFSAVLLYAVNVLSASLNKYELYESSQGVFLLNKRHGEVYKYGRITMKSGDLWEEGWFENPVKDRYETSESFKLLAEHESSKKAK
jgi:hypothetical protein